MPIEKLKRAAAHGLALHAALCEALDVPVGRGDRKRVVQALGRLLHDDDAPTPSRYSNVITGSSWSFDKIEPWCRVAGIRMVIEDGAARYEVRTRSPS